MRGATIDVPHTPVSVDKPAHQMCVMMPMIVLQHTSVEFFSMSLMANVLSCS